MRYSYYPGCSAHSTGLEYSLSTEATLRQLDVELEEIEGWNCCGASSAHALNHRLALTLPARNLALAQKAGGDLLIPCAACYNRLKGAELALRSNSEARAEIEADVGFSFTGQVRIRPLLAILHEDFGPQRVAAETRRPLSGLKVVPYYGCLLVRPPRVAQFDDPDDPRLMASLLRAAGAEVMPWSHATDCCGAGLSLPRSDAVYRLVGRLAERAREAGAEALVTACPLCQVNLEMRQPATPRLPAFYFTELLGLAFDLPEARRWWPKHLIDPRPLLRSHNLAD
ncbi:MAG TPA: CoB--CoM heterodisulfide reductase iron-sulfur subunit B family protein [Anaerolineales bacterium]|nr:CoB--CoM heterodisulfide reductase iron-sulfur subunit B family protein [Anaerolineales bacterium]